MIFGTLIREARENMHLSQEEAAKAISVKYKGVRLSPAYLSMIEGGSRTNLTTDLVKALCKYFQLPSNAVNYLLDIPIPETYPVGQTKRLDVYGEIRAGQPMLVREEIIGYEYISAEDICGGDYFFLRVKGDSMIGKRIQEGDLVLVRKQPVIEEGQIGVFIVGDEATIKIFHKQGNLAILTPANPSLKPIVALLKDVIVVGEVVKIVVKLNGR